MGYSANLSARDMQYIVRGKIAPFGANRALVGMETYLSSPGHYYIWDGKHKAVVFEDWNVALEAAASARGPLWRMPDPETVEIVQVD